MGLDGVGRNGADGGEGGLCMAEVEEMDGEESMLEMKGSDVAKGMELGSEGRFGSDGDRSEEEGAGGGGGEVRWRSDVRWRRRRRRRRKWERKRKRVPLNRVSYGWSELLSLRV